MGHVLGKERTVAWYAGCTPSFPACSRFLLGPEMGTSDVPPFRLTLAEVAGAFGDLATLGPLLVGLITVNHLNPTGVFLVVGLAYILSGLTYRLPVPVQPLKAVSATAIALGLSAGVVSASGWLMGLLLLVLAAGRLIEPIARLFTRPVVRGIQLGLGLLLLQSAWKLIAGPALFPEAAVLPPAVERWPIRLILVLGAALLLLAGLLWRRLPTSLLILGLGLSASLALGVSPAADHLRWGFRFPTFYVPTLSDLTTAAWLLVIPQLPLTVGNATIATADAAQRYFGPRAVRVRPRTLLVTMGLSNLLAGLLGGMPVCHGSGGLTAHVRFGARTGTAPLLIGGLCLGAALLLDGGMLPLLVLFPLPVLGVLLFYVGVQHGLLVADLRRPDEWGIAVGIAVSALLLNNLAVGFLAGMVLCRLPLLLRRLAEVVKRR